MLGGSRRQRRAEWLHLDELGAARERARGGRGDRIIGPPLPLALWIVAHSAGVRGSGGRAAPSAACSSAPPSPTPPGASPSSPRRRRAGRGARVRAPVRGGGGAGDGHLIGFGQMVGVFLTSSTTAVLVYAVPPARVRPELNWRSWAVLRRPRTCCSSRLVAPSSGSTGRAGPSGWRARSRALSRCSARCLASPSRAERLSLVVGAGLAPWLRHPAVARRPARLGRRARARRSGRDARRERRYATRRQLELRPAVRHARQHVPAVFTDARVDRWIAGIVTASVQRSRRRAYRSSWPRSPLLCFAVSLVLRWQAAAPLLTIALAPVAAAAGISPFVVGLVTLIACNGFFLPYQSTTYLALYHGTGGSMFTHRQARLAASPTGSSCSGRSARACPHGARWGCSSRSRSCRCPVKCPPNCSVKMSAHRSVRVAAGRAGVRVGGARRAAARGAGARDGAGAGPARRAPRSAKIARFGQGGDRGPPPRTRSWRRVGVGARRGTRTKSAAGGGRGGQAAPLIVDEQPAVETLAELDAAAGVGAAVRAAGDLDQPGAEADGVVAGDAARVAAAEPVGEVARRAAPGGVGSAGGWAKRRLWSAR